MRILVPHNYSIIHDVEFRHQLFNIQNELLEGFIQVRLINRKLCNFAFFYLKASPNLGRFFILVRTSLKISGLDLLKPSIVAFFYFFKISCVEIVSTKIVNHVWIFTEGLPELGYVFNFHQVFILEN